MGSVKRGWPGAYLLPTEGSMPASASRSVYRMDTYCDPRSEWWIRASRYPVSRSCCRTQVCSVWAEQPIFAAIDWIAAHCDGSSLRCSNTIRTERSRTSGEYFVVFFMAPSSQELEPPRKSGRFRLYYFTLFTVIRSLATENSSKKPTSTRFPRARLTILRNSGLSLSVKPAPLATVSILIGYGSRWLAK